MLLRRVLICQQHFRTGYYDMDVAAECMAGRNSKTAYSCVRNVQGHKQCTSPTALIVDDCSAESCLVHDKRHYVAAPKYLLADRSACHIQLYK